MNNFDKKIYWLSRFASCRQDLVGKSHPIINFFFWISVQSIIEPDKHGCRCQHKTNRLLTSSGAFIRRHESFKCRAFSTRRLNVTHCQSHWVSQRMPQFCNPRRRIGNMQESWVKDTNLTFWNRHRSKLQIHLRLVQHHWLRHDAHHRSHWRPRCHLRLL